MLISIPLTNNVKLYKINLILPQLFIFDITGNVSATNNSMNISRQTQNSVAASTRQQFDQLYFPAPGNVSVEECDAIDVVIEDFFVNRSIRRNIKEKSKKIL